MAKIASVEAFDIYDSGLPEGNRRRCVKINDNPVGTGPYNVKEWVRGDHITFVPNPTYCGEQTANNTFILKWNKKPLPVCSICRLATSAVLPKSPLMTATIEADPNLQLTPRKFNNFLYLGINDTTALRQ